MLTLSANLRGDRPWACAHEASSRKSVFSLAGLTTPSSHNHTHRGVVTVVIDSGIPTLDTSAFKKKRGGVGTR